MIAKLRGLLDSTGDGWAVVDVAGVGYMVFCGSRTLAAFPAKGEFVELSIETHVRENHIHLYGFATNVEREMFQTLTTVQGVGAKVGLGILSALSAAQIAQAIAAEDAGAFKKIGGVGPKLAARLVTELKGKLPILPAFGNHPVATPVKKSKDAGRGNIAEEAVSALVNLGYGRTDAFGAVARATQSVGDSAALTALIKSSLRELGGADG
jgi:Holliday junction DNA helicase RuvA